MSLINFYSRTTFELTDRLKIAVWIGRVIRDERKSVGNINYIFTTDQDLLEMNRHYLGHDYFTDILTFDYTEGNRISGDIFISIDRVEENAASFGAVTDDELRRVMVHGVLHLMGYGDDSAEEKEAMRRLETEKMGLFHVEQ